MIGRNYTCAPQEATQTTHVRTESETEHITEGADENKGKQSTRRAVKTALANLCTAKFVVGVRLGFCPHFVEHCHEVHL
jgi:hypothetical protein